MRYSLLTTKISELDISLYYELGIRAANYYEFH
jgi:hypothetical protein